MRGQGRARHLGLAWVAALTIGCGGGTAAKDDGADADVEVDSGPQVPPTLQLWTPGGAEGPPGAWIDAVVSASGTLGSGPWTLTIEGLPAQVAASFEPATISADHGALLRLDVATSAAVGVVVAKVVATRGGERIEADLPLTIVERSDIPADFMLQVRPPAAIGPTGAVETRLEGENVAFPAQVLSLAGFAGEVRLLAQDPTGTVRVVPSKVTVEPGKPAAIEVQVRVTDEPPGPIAAVHRRTWHAAGGLPLGDVTMAPAPGLTLLPMPRTWLAPGGQAKATLLARTFGLAAPDLALTAGTAAGLSATATPFTSLAATITVAATTDASPGPRELPFTVSAQGHKAERSARIVVLGPTSALASSELLAPPLPSSNGEPAKANALSLVVDSAGLELGRQDAGWWRAREAKGFAAEFMGQQAPLAQIGGVLGGRATATAAGVSIDVTETRSDVVARTWSIPGGAAPKVALAYDSAKRLWCAAAVAPGVPRVWRMDATASATAVPEELSTGLPTQAIAMGPWLAAGEGAPTLAFVKEGVFRVQQWSGAAWSELPPPGLAEGQLPRDVGLVMDDVGRPVLAWVEDAAVRVVRLEGGAWAELGPVPRASTPVPRELGLLIDRGAPVVVWTEANYEPPPLAQLADLASRVWLTRFESDAWRTPVDMQLDANADARALEAVLGPDGKLVVAWTEDGAVVLTRGQP